MKFTIKTEKLQEMVSRAVKGCSNNKMIPITGLMSIELSNNDLILTTTDASNYLYIIEDKIAGEDFSIVVQADTFSKLVSRMTTENIELELKGEELIVHGNGKYNIELPLDEEGGLIKFPKVWSNEMNMPNTYDVHLTTIKELLTYNKPALATSLDVPCYTGYYMGDKVVTTDTYKICSTDVKLFDEPMLIAPEMMDLLDVMSDENITVSVDDNVLVFVTPDCVVYGKTLEGVDTYKIDAISSLLEHDYPCECSVSRDNMLQALDRLSLFVGPYDKSGIRMLYTKDGIMLSNIKYNSTEVVPYKSSENFKEFSCCINIDMLQTQVKAHVLDEIHIFYGLDNAVKIEDGIVTQLIAYEEEKAS